MFISLEQIQLSLERIEEFNPFFGMSFLAFKKAGIPIGKTVKVNFTQIATNVLEKHYKPSSLYTGYYNPFDTSDKENRWTAVRYPSTSLQRITKDTFSDALLHPAKTDWGWRDDYISKLVNHLPARKIPAFDFSVWLFRSENWFNTISPQDIIRRLFDEYNILEEEIRDLFDTNVSLLADNWLVPTLFLENELIEVIGHPPGVLPETGAALKELKLRSIGPASEFVYEPALRLNVITGDNSLGKTFLLESVWWALTGSWVDRPLSPRTDVAKTTPSIEFSLSTERGKLYKFEAKYDWNNRNWKLPSKRNINAGLVIYARHDGSFTIWDPSRLTSNDSVTASQPDDKLHLRRDDIWFGLTAHDRRDWLCNGLLRDWVTWQTSGIRYQERWNIFVSALKTLAPLGEAIEPVEPKKLDFSDLEMPMLKLPYGEVPVLHASAGIQRALALTYVLVWSWFRHLENSSIVRKEPQKRLVLLVDEVEAHLHPKWQRIVVPSLMNVISKIAPVVSPQIHLATHSPLIMASLEPVFDEEIDDLHNLVLEGSEVSLRELEFVKRGRVDWWLMSDVFGLGNARSVPAEKAIEDAKKIQLMANPNPKEVQKINSDLVENLAQDDDFWPRWRYFAKQYGVI